MEARSAKRRRQVDVLYELWDVNASGYLELEEIQVVLNKWRSDGIETFKEGNNQEKKMNFLENTVKFRMKILCFGQPWFFLWNWGIIGGKLSLIWGEKGTVV